MTLQGSEPETAKGGMSRHWRNESARMLAAELELILRHHKAPITRETLGVAGQLAGKVLLAVASLPAENRLAILSARELLPDAICRLVLSLASDFSPRDQLDANGKDGAGTPVDTNPIDSPPACPPLLLVQSWAGDVAGQSVLEHELKIPRSTLHLWRRRNEVIALPRSRRNHVYPLAQFIDGRPVDGISRVLAAIPNPRTAWQWLVIPSDLLGGDLPLNLLKHGREAQVADAAVAYARVVLEMHEQGSD